MAFVLRDDVVQWHFKNHGRFEAIKGGVDSFAFKLNLDTFVREVVQNINDARVDQSTPAEAEFILEDFNGKNLTDLLNLIGWNSGLEDHLKGVADGKSHQKESARKALDAVNAKSVRVLTIVDSGTRGLTGEETGDSGNFAMLCRNVLVTDEESKAVKGGSFGIGKSVLWAFSSASTVLFSSIPLEPSGLGPLRFIGRAYFPSHFAGAGKTKEHFVGDGWFGNIADEDGDTGAVSVRGTKAASHLTTSALKRGPKNHGASILIPFFEHPLDNKKYSLDMLSKEICAATAKWFWPAISDGDLKATVVVRKDGVDSKTKVVLPSWVEVFIRAREAKSGSRLIVDEAGASKSALMIPFPKLSSRDKTEASFESEVEFSIARITEREEAELEKVELQNTVATMRGAKMVVEYSTKLPDSLPDFVGVLQVGRACGLSVDNHKADNFFRNAEPPAHNRWEVTPKLKDFYGAAAGKDTLEKLRQLMIESAKKMLGVTSVSGEKVPKKLSELLSGQRKGKIVNPRIETFRSELDDLKWTDYTLSGRATLNRNRGNKAWSARVGLVLVTESGRRTELDHEIDDLKIISPAGLVAMKSPQKSDKLLKENWSPGYVINVPAGVTEVKIELSGSAKRLGNETVRRSRSDLAVTFQSSTENSL